MVLLSLFRLIGVISAMFVSNVQFRALSFKLNPLGRAAIARMMSSANSDVISRMKVKKLMESSDSIVGQTIMVQGWVRTIRKQKNFSFIELNDGSCLSNAQTVADSSLLSYNEVEKLHTGSAAEIIGTVVVSPGKGQKYEIKATSVKIIGDCPGDDYPLQKKRHSLEFLRSIAHLRPRTSTISAVSRIRSALALATHQFFQSEGFVYFQSPLITSSDCEGAGEMFRVTTLPLDDVKSIKTVENGTAADFTEDFFSKPAFLTVSGQLSGEAYASALGDIYTFGPTFRAEKSLTSRHLAEFHMIEPEMAFCDLNQSMHNAEKYVKHVVAHVLKHCEEDLDFFNNYVDKSLKERLNKLVNEPFVRISYTDAIALLQEEIVKNGTNWVYKDLKFGSDLQSEHERWLAEKKFNACVFVYNYPRQIKSFYMRDNPDGQTVDSFDLLVPGVGELIGGSAREERLDVLRKKLSEFGLKEEDYQWYLDLRRFGSVPHAGYGLGFERLVCYVTGIENIKDAIGFPRYYGSAEF